MLARLPNISGFFVFQGDVASIAGSLQNSRQPLQIDFLPGAIRMGDDRFQLDIDSPGSDRLHLFVGIEIPAEVACIEVDYQMGVIDVMHQFH